MRRWTAPLSLLLLATGCEVEHMTKLEALDALDQVHQSSRGEAATGDVIEVSTDVTIGDALADAAERIAAFWESQAPCSEVTLEGARLTVDYGTLDDACTFEGQTYAGVNTVEVVDTTLGRLQVDHAWTGFTNGEVTVDGGATVTWTGEDATRRVETTHTWSDATGETVDVVGDHTQGPLDGEAPGWAGWLGGIWMDGDREWTGNDGTYVLDMTDLEMRWIDPAPQAGSLTVANPDGKTLDVVYERVDEDTIQATLVGLRDDLVVHIDRIGRVEEVEP